MRDFLARLREFLSTLPEEWRLIQYGSELLSTYRGAHEDPENAKLMTPDFWIAHSLLALARVFFWIVLVNCSHPNMIDESYGGPETGCMAGSCPRCGFSFHTTLY